MNHSSWCIVLGGLYASLLVCAPTQAQSSTPDSPRDQAQPPPPASAPVQEPASVEARSALEVRLSPDRLRLDQAVEVEVRVALSGPLAHSEPASKLDLRVNVGSLLDVRREGPGQWVARYLPPPIASPQVALFVAIAGHGKDSVMGWAALPMSGVGKCLVYSRPHSKVTLRVGDDEFGPVMTNSKGVASISVVVPPGIQFGLSDGKKVPLSIPPFNRLTATSERAEIPTERRQGTRIWVAVVEPSGAPDRKLDLRVQARKGQVTAPTLVRPGVALLEYLPPLVDQGSHDQVSIRLPGEPVSQVNITLTLVSSTPPSTLPPSAPPSSSPRFGLALQAGGFSNLSRLQGMGLLLSLLWNPAFLSPRWSLQIGSGTLLSPKTVQVDGVEASSTLLMVPLTLSVSYRILDARRGFLSWRMGGGLEWITHSRQIKGQEQLRSRAAAPGISLGLGSGLPLPVGTLTLEASFQWMGLRNDEVVSGSLGSGGLFLGYQLPLF